MSYKRLIESLEDRRLLSASLLNGVVTVTGTAGNDTISISKNDVSLITKVNSETKLFKLTAINKAVINALGGNDTISVASSVYKVVTINGGDGNDVMTGGSGADTLNGGNGNDTENGGAGNDKCDGGAGDDKIDGGTGNDVETGGSGNDTELGSGGDDNLDGGDGNDTIDGGIGNDTLAGRGGVNTLRGGTGRDRFVSGSGADVVCDEEDADEGEDGGTEHPSDGLVSFGTVSAIVTTPGSGVGTITVTVLGDKAAATPKKFNVTAGTVITANDAAVSLDNLPLNVKVFVVTSPADPTTATKIVVVAATTEGKVLAVDTTANTITLKGVDGKPARVFTVAANAAITVNGVPATLADIVVGAEVKLQLWALDPTVAVGIRAHSENGGDDDGGEHDSKAFGTIVSTTATTITLAGEPGAPNRTFTLAAGATVTVDGVAADPATLPVGLKVSLKLSSTDPTVATSVTAVGPRAEGKVLAVDAVAGTITLSGHEKLPPATYTVPATAKITLDGAVVTLDKVPLGAEVHIQLSALDGKTVISVSADTEDGDDNEGTEGKGQIVSVDALNNKITLSIPGKDGQPATQVTFDVSATAKIVVDGVATTLDKLPVGLTIDFKATTATPPVIVEIEAEGTEIEGRVASVNTATAGPGTLGTITLKGRDGKPDTTYTVDAGAAITLNKLTTTLDKIPAGAEVELRLSALTGHATEVSASAG